MKTADRRTMRPPLDLADEGVRVVAAAVLEQAGLLEHAEALRSLASLACAESAWRAIAPLSEAFTAALHAFVNGDAAAERPCWVVATAGDMVRNAYHADRGTGPSFAKHVAIDARKLGIHEAALS